MEDELSLHPASHHRGSREGDLNMRLTIFTLVFIVLYGCKTTSQPPAQPSGEALEEVVYDGFAYTDDALPDCTSEMIGSRFWIRGIRQAVECSANGQWNVRDLQAPDEDEEPAESFSPRAIRPGA